MTETMWKVINELYATYMIRGQWAYIEHWNLQQIVGVDLEGCGCPGDPAVTLLLKMGLIEEVPDLNCRYRIKVEADNVPH